MQRVDAFYTKTISSLEFQLDSVQKSRRKTANVRVVIAILVAASVYAAVNLNTSILWISPLLIGWFVVMVKKSSKLEREQQIIERKLALNRNELAFMNGSKDVFDAGSALIPRNHLYALDLDIFGTGSLFQTVNRTVTFEGRDLLVTALLNPPIEPTVVTQRRAASTELRDASEWRQQFYALGALSGETASDSAEMRTWVLQEKFFNDKKQWPWIAGVMSAISSSFIAYMILKGAFNFGPFLGLMAFNSFLIQWIGKDIKKYFLTFGQRTKLYEKFSELFSMVAARNFTSPLCKEAQSKSRTASAAFLKLSRLSNLADQRLNGFMGPVMNGLFLFDIWTIRRIEEWRATHGAQIDEWIQALAQMDMINSLANFSFNHPAFCTAVIDGTSKAIVASEMGHPLLPANAIKNDYEVGVSTRAHIITGSNMAGKSTFIRATGLNVILALNGLPVCARKFSCPVLRVVTCIRITDSLEDDTSYFKAELLRLKHIIDVLGEGVECLVLLDEILRGTNSDDKRNGTMAFYRKLRNYDCLALLATHDLAVGELEKEDPSYFGNYCFESTVIDQSLHFDYKLRKGGSASTNASFLMKGLGLID
ncbi:MAG TPA: hypothetical protein VG737_08175 [Cyclobacteriaceae bacterium]|nr:hypothetical protein [Cyclobacteriaceae bacterium]